MLQRISYADLNVEEIGGIYESLLDFAPRVTAGAESVDGRDIPPHTFFLDPRGTARKTTGSYYTHPSLVNALIESALMPVLEDRVKTTVGTNGYTASPKGEGLSLNLEALTSEQKDAAENAILSLKVCDPAMGSGHFLIAANNALALRLAQIRSGDDYPAERELRRARRDVLAHCIYGVDLNPMAVELCKVSLWINAAVDDAPLSFLDHHLKCGNSLIGATPELLKNGIPDNAFKPVTGDDKKVAAAIRKRNKKERSGQLSLWQMTVIETLADLSQWRELNQLAEDAPQLAESRYRQYQADPAYRNARLVADLWTAAFFWPLMTHSTGSGQADPDDYIPTEEVFRQAQADPNLLPGKLVDRVAELAQHHNFFHWHLEFLDVFGEKGEGGFDVVLGNPPWERIKLQEKEFFATRDLEIVNARTAAIRRKLIAKLPEINPALAAEFATALRQSEGESKFIRDSKRYPLTGRGDVNTYQVFAEFARNLPNDRGRAGIIVPTGIATDFTNRDFFANLIDAGRLASLFDFENKLGLFPEVHREQKFSLLTQRGPAPIAIAEFAFFLLDPNELSNSERRFILTSSDFARLNPNTKTCPVFRSRTDADLTRRLYAAAPVLYNEETDKNPWGISFLRMFDMTNDSGLFRTYEQLETQGFILQGNYFVRADEKYLPLYEGKLTQIYDHRVATFADLISEEIAKGNPREVTEQEHQTANVSTLTRFWISHSEVQHVLSRQESPSHWLTFHDIANPNNERTFITTICPAWGMGNTLPLLIGSLGAIKALLISGNWNSFVFDYVSRLKVGSRHMNFFVVKQLPVLPPGRYTSDLLTYIVPRVLELTYTAWDLRAFADDVWAEANNKRGTMSDEQEKASSLIAHHSSLPDAILRQWEENRGATNGGHAGAKPPEWVNLQSPNLQKQSVSPFPHPPFKWDETRRAQLRADLDGLYGHLYGLTRDELTYILDTFPIVRRKDEARYGEYRTKRMVLEAYDKIRLNDEGGRLII